jgi:hypothetical protein
MFSKDSESGILFLLLQQSRDRFLCDASKSAHRVDHFNGRRLLSGRASTVAQFTDDLLYRRVHGFTEEGWKRESGWITASLPDGRIAGGS